MEKVLELFSWASTDGAKILAATNVALGGLIGVCLLIPGSQPEAFFLSVSKFLSKFSKK